MARLSVFGAVPKRKQNPAVYEGSGTNCHKVTGKRPEAQRSKPGQGEAEVKLGGGLQKFYIYVFF